MSWLSIGAAIIGGFAGKKSNKAARQSQDQATQVQRDQFNRFKKIYGPIEENLAGYYGGLKSGSFAAKRIEDLNAQVEKFDIDTQRDRAQRGLNQNSAAAAYLDETKNLLLAESKAGIRADSEQQVRDAQLGFLNGAPGRVNPNSKLLSKTLTNKSEFYTQRGARQAQGVKDLISSFGGV